MGTRNARRRRRRAEFAAAARAASSRERNTTFVPVEVSPLPARRSAMPPCRSPNTVAFSSFSCLPPPRIIGGDDVWRIDRLLTQNIYRIRHAAMPCKSPNTLAFSSFSCPPPRRILGGDDAWRIDRLLTQKLRRSIRNLQWSVSNLGYNSARARLSADEHQFLGRGPGRQPGACS